MGDPARTSVSYKDTNLIYPIGVDHADWASA